MVKPHIQVLVGMVSSGKSTYALNAARAGCVVVNDDAIVTAIHGGDYKLYDARLKPLYKGVEMGLATAAIAAGRAVIVDRGLNVSKRARRRWIALADSIDVPVTAILFRNEGPFVHAQRRADHDGRGYGFDYWLGVAKAHHSRWEEPSLSEGFYEVCRPGFAAVADGSWFPLEWTP